jgi:small redox-active disulfide protein 2
MKIQVFGSGCLNCKRFFEQTKQAVSELGLDAQVEYSDDIQKIIDLGAMSSPALVINNKLVLVGQVTDVEKIKEIIANYKTTKSESAGGCCCGHC